MVLKASALSFHLKWAHATEEDRVLCEPCQEFFKQADSYRRHLLTDTHKNTVTLKNEDILQAAEALKNDSIASVLQGAASSASTMETENTNADQFECSDGCTQVFGTLKELQDHVIYVHLDTYRCTTTCDIDLETNGKWWKHMKKCHLEHDGLVQCPLVDCQRRFDRSDSILRHFREIHAPKDKVICKLCDQKHSRRHYVRHLESCATNKVLKRMPGRSKYERIVWVCLTEFAEQFHHDHCFQGLVSDKGKFLKVDFYLPARNMIIEFHGQMHYQVSSYRDGDKQFERGQQHDKLKEEYAAAFGIAYHILDHKNHPDYHRIKTALSVLLSK
jgi:hypothetical protein